MDDMLPLDFAIPMHVFAREAADFYEVVTASRDGAAVTLAGGSQVIPDAGVDALRTADTVIVPGYDKAATRTLERSVLEELRAASSRGARIASICSGAFALAQAGLLDGLTVTTHWALSDELARGFPAVTVDAGALFIDEDRVLTSGGVMAGVDLVLHILRKDRGRSIANHMARRIVMTSRVGGQGQFSELPVAVQGDDAVSLTQAWMSDRLESPIPIVDMAHHAHLSPRQFHRRFVDDVGQTPLAWLHEQRIARAKELLEATDDPVDEVARRVGLGTAANFRVHFRRATGISPTAYRRAFHSSTALGVG